MSYCSYNDVLNMTGTNLGSAVVGGYIDLADAEIDGMLDEYSLTGSSGSNLLKNASILLTIKYILVRYRVDGTKPASLSIGDMSMSDNPDQAINNLQAQAQKMVDLYAKKTLGQPYATTEAEVDTTHIRQDHEMPAFNLDQSMIPEYHDRTDEIGNQDGEEV